MGGVVDGEVVVEADVEAWLAVAVKIRSICVAFCLYDLLEIAGILEGDDEEMPFSQGSQLYIHSSPTKPRSRGQSAPAHDEQCRDFRVEMRQCQPGGRYCLRVQIRGRC